MIHGPCIRVNEAWYSWCIIVMLLDNNKCLHNSLTIVYERVCTTHTLSMSCNVYKALFIQFSFNIYVQYK